MKTVVSSHSPIPPSLWIHQDHYDLKILRRGSSVCVNVCRRVVSDTLLSESTVIDLGVPTTMLPYLDFLAALEGLLSEGSAHAKTVVL